MASLSASLWEKGDCVMFIVSPGPELEEVPGKYHREGQKRSGGGKESKRESGSMAG